MGDLQGKGTAQCMASLNFSLQVHYNKIRMYIDERLKFLVSGGLELFTVYCNE
jgi:hypothetical protein